MLRGVLRTRALSVLRSGEKVHLPFRGLGLCVYGEQLTQNWSGQGESDCLIKTKHCDGHNWC